jgi:hypothetical protein
VRLPSPRDRFGFPRRQIDRSPRRLTCWIVHVRHSRRPLRSTTPPIGSSSCTIVSTRRTIVDRGLHDARYTQPDRLTAERNAPVTSAPRLVSDAHAFITWLDRVIEASGAVIGRSLLEYRAAASSRRVAASSQRADASAHHAVALPRRDVAFVARDKRLATPTAGCTSQRRRGARRPSLADSYEVSRHRLENAHIGAVYSIPITRA